MRTRVLDLLSVESRFTLLCAMPGYGKTVAVRQWVDTVDLPVAWVALDLLDGDPASFWSHVLRVIGSVLDGVDAEPAKLLAERGPDDTLFLAALIAELESRPDRLLLVLDGLDQLDRGVLDGLALLVERLGDRVAFVVTSRAEPALPLARWRALGWLNELHDDDLRLTDDEAALVAGQPIRRTDLAEDAVALNGQVEGWPIAFHMALLSKQPTGGSTRSLFESLRSDRTLANYLVAHVLDSLGDDERETALSLSVLEWFDSDLCAGLVGPQAGDAVRQLLARGVFLSVIDQTTGAMRFHGLFRELLELQLGWRDPARRIELHRRAAMLWRSRGDLMAAHRHLSAIGEAGRAHQILVSPALELVDRGDMTSLQKLAHQLPAIGDVDDVNLAIDLALVAFYASGTVPARRWCDRSAMLVEAMPTDSPMSRGRKREAARRLGDVRGAVALLDADLVTAIELIDQRGAPVSPADPATFEERFPILAARVMLATRRRDDADRWIHAAEHIPGPGILASVTVPTLRAWHEWMFGRLDVATKLVDDALAWMEEHFVGAHPLAFDTLITAGWCRVSTGDLTGAADLARRAQSDAAILDGKWNHLQAGYLAARLALVTGDPQHALREIDDLRARIAFDSCRPYADRLLGLEIEALAAMDVHADELAPLIDALQPGPRAQILRARFVTRDLVGIELELADRATWPIPEQLHAGLLLAVRGDPSRRREMLDRLVADCADSGWVLPFLEVGPSVRQMLRTDHVERIHPKLAAALAQAPAASEELGSTRTQPQLTARERSLLGMLPTHLSYADMGEQLYLSVNTIKTNLKSLYRKLDANTRAQAVEIARRQRLL